MRWTKALMVRVRAQANELNQCMWAEKLVNRRYIVFPLRDVSFLTWRADEFRGNALFIVFHLRASHRLRLSLHNLYLSPWRPVDQFWSVLLRLYMAVTRRGMSQVYGSVLISRWVEYCMTLIICLHVAYLWCIWPQPGLVKAKRLQLWNIYVIFSFYIH